MIRMNDPVIGCQKELLCTMTAAQCDSFQRGCLVVSRRKLDMKLDAKEIAKIKEWQVSPISYLATKEL